MQRLENCRQNTEGAVIPIGEAGFPAPFADTLEFSTPVHGTWNIVHTGMLIPETHQIYICSPNCMRGVVLTAAEMNTLDRFSQVVIEEKDVLTGSIEKLTAEGVSDCLQKLPRLPRAVLVFTVCIHHFMGCDLDWIYEELEKRFPQVDFIRCFMDPVMRKSGLTPDQKMRRSLYEAVRPLPVRPKTAALLGSDFAADEDSDLKTLLRSGGWELKELPRADTYEEYLSTGESSLFISVYPNARAGAEELAKRLDRPHIHLPQTFDAEEIRQNERCLARAIAALPRNLSKEEEKASQALKKAGELAADMPVAVDYTVHPRPLGLAKLLLRAGFNVQRIYTDTISPEEKSEFYYLKENYPDLLLCATVNPKCRLLHGMEKNEFLAIGQKAAWFTGSRHFVNIVEGAGWYGFNGILKLADKITDALNEEKNPEIITLKGLGCESCVL